MATDEQQSRNNGDVEGEIPPLVHIDSQKKEEVPTLFRAIRNMASQRDSKPKTDDASNELAVTDAKLDTGHKSPNHISGVLSGNVIQLQLQDMPPAPMAMSPPPQHPLLPNTRWDNIPSQGNVDDEQSEAPTQVRRMVTFHTVKDRPVIQSVQRVDLELVEPRCCRQRY